MLAMKNKHIGSSFDDFLKEEGIYKEARCHAIKRVIGWQLAEAMKAKKISNAEMARRLKTSRTQVARFLDPENCSVQLDTMQKAAAIVGKRLIISLEDIPRSEV
jgi:antitoxin HicB